MNTNDMPEMNKCDTCNLYHSAGYCKYYDKPTLLICDIPTDIIEASLKLSKFFEARNFNNWKLGGCMARVYEKGEISK